MNEESFDMEDKLPYTIHECDEKFFVNHAEELSALCRKSFHEHEEKGLNFGPVTMTAERFAQRAKDNIGQYAEIDGRIIAFWNAKPDNDARIVYGDILAVDPEFKGKHIGLSLTNKFIRSLEKKGFNLFITDTSLSAPHVVAFHKRYGCKAVGMRHFYKRTYRSVILRLALNRQNEISDFHAAVLFFFSSMKCRAITKENGESTLLGKLIEKFKRK